MTSKFVLLKNKCGSVSNEKIKHKAQSCMLLHHAEKQSYK